MKNDRRRYLLWMAALGAVILSLGFIYLKFKPMIVPGEKEIRLEVVFPEGETEEYSAHTDAEYLEQAMEAMTGLTVEGSRTAEFGLMVIAVNGISADYTRDGAYWALLLDDKPCSYGVSRQPVRDGEAYRLVYTPAR